MNKFYVSENYPDISTWTENDIFYQLFYLLIDFEELRFLGIEFTADGQTLTAYDGKWHTRLENSRELETYFFNIEGFTIKKLIEEYNKCFT